MKRHWFLICSFLSVLGADAFAQTGPRAIEISQPAPSSVGGDTEDTSHEGNESLEADYFTGAATHRIAIEVPPGRAGMQPKLILEYNSHRREEGSVVGFGWDLNPGYIERSTQTAVDYNGKDFVFAAHGQRRQLAASNHLSPNGCEEYNAKVETGDFIRYFYCTDHWVAYDKEGVQYLFGSSLDARLADAGHTKNFRWYLQEIRDLNGNFVEFDYLKKVAIGDSSFVVLNRILYTRHDAIAASPFFIQFSYDSTPDPKATIIRPAQFFLFSGQLLRKIEIFDNGNLVRSYDFNYERNPSGSASLLKSLQLTASNGSQTIRLPTKTFDYSTSDNTFNVWGTQMQQNVSLPGDDLSLYDETHGFFDLNGDGYLDRVVGLPGQHKFNVYYGSPSGPQNVPVAWSDKWDDDSLDGKISADFYYVDGVHARILDMNGDLLPDRVYGGNNIPLRDGTVFSGFFIFFNTGKEWRWTQLWNDPLCNPNIPAFDGLCGQLFDTAELLDVTGDGLPDRIYWDGATLHVYRNLGKSFSTQAEDWIDPVYPYQQTAFLRDMNGDHLPDRVQAISYGQYGFQVFLNTGHGWSTQASYFMSDPDGTGAMDETADLIDIDRDGLPDRVVGNATTHTIRIYWNRGQSFEDRNFAEVKDPAQDLLAGKIRYGNYPGLLDLNGDGYLDRIVPTGTGDAAIATFRPQKGQGLYLLTQTNNGLGVDTQIEYTPASRFENHLLPLALHAVTKITVKEGAELKTTDIRYAGGYFYPDFFNPLGHLFDGFNFVEIHDSLGNVEQRWYHQAWDGVIDGKLFAIPNYLPTDLSSPLPVQTATDQSGNEGWKHVSLSGRIYKQVFYFDPRDGRGLTRHHEIDQTWRTLNTSSPVSDFVFLSHMEKKDYEGGGSPRQTGRDWEYDTATGNKTSETDLGEMGIDTPHRAEFGDFHVIPLAEFGNLVTSKAKTIVTKEGSSLRNKTTRVFDAKGNLTGLTQLLMDANGTRDLTTTFAPDAFGNIFSRTDPLGRKTTYTYDPVYQTYPETESIMVSGRAFTTQRLFNGTFGKVAAITTPDGRTSNFQYDPLGRLTQKSFNKRWQERYVYLDRLARPNLSGQFLTAVKKLTDIDSDPKSATLAREVTYRDGQGRILQHSVRSERSNGTFRTEVQRYIQSRQSNDKIIYQLFFTGDDSFVEGSAGYSASQINDSLNRLVQNIPPPGDAGSPTAPRTIQYSFQGDPWVKVLTDETGKIRREAKNGRGELQSVWEVASGAQLTTSYGYDFWSNRIETRDTSGNTSRLGFDNLGRKINESDMDRGRWRYKYDDVGNLIEETDARGVKSIFIYDNLNRILSRESRSPTGVAAERVTYQYDQPVTSTGGNERGNYSVHPGELFEVVDRQGWTRFGYDSWGTVNKVNRQIAGLSGSAVTEYLRDPDGRILEMKYPGGQVHLQYQYDAGGQVWLVQRLGYQTEELYRVNPDTAYDQTGHLLQTNYGNGTQDAYAYYPNSLRLKGIQTTGASSGQQEALRDLSYQYNAVGNSTDMRDNLNGDIHNAGLADIQYDDLHRVTGYSYHQGDGSGLKTEKYAYDALGNMTKNSESYGSDSFIYGVAGHAHALKQVGAEKFAYDENGNMTRGRGRQMDYDGRNRLEKVTLENGREVTYGYGGFGERLFKKTSGTGGTGETYYFGNYLEVEDGNLIHNIYVGDKLIAMIGEGAWGQTSAMKTMPGWYAGKLQMDRYVAKPMAVLLCAGGLLWLLIVIGNQKVPGSLWGRGPKGTWYIFGFPLASSRSYVVCLLIVLLIFPTGTFAYVFPSDFEDHWPPADQSFFLYIHTDHLRSSNLMTEGQEKSTHNGIRFIKGEIVQRIEYTPFGKERYVLNAALKQGPKFTDQVNDIEDDLYFYQSRYYDPVLGRFIQPDTVPAAGPNPQTINAYSYALNNPLKYIDPTGHAADPPENSEKDRADINDAIAAIDRELGKIDKAKEALEGYGTISDKDIDHALGREPFSDRFDLGPGAREIHEAFDIGPDIRALAAVEFGFTQETVSNGFHFGKIALGAWFVFEGVNTFLSGIGLAIVVGLETGGIGFFLTGLTASPAFFMLGRIQYQHGRELIEEGLGHKK